MGYHCRDSARRVRCMLVPQAEYTLLMSGRQRGKKLTPLLFAVRRGGSGTAPIQNAASIRKRVQTRLRSYLAALVSVPIFLGAQAKQPWFVLRRMKSRLPRRYASRNDDGKTGLTNSCSIRLSGISRSWWSAIHWPPTVAHHSQEPRFRKVTACNQNARALPTLPEDVMSDRFQR